MLKYFVTFFVLKQFQYHVIHMVMSTAAMPTAAMSSASMPAAMSSVTTSSATVTTTGNNDFHIRSNYWTMKVCKRKCVPSSVMTPCISQLPSKGQKGHCYDNLRIYKRKY